MVTKEQLQKKPFYLNEEQCEWVYSTLKELDTDEKLGQLFCANIREGTMDEIKGIMDISPIGGVMYRPLEIEDAIQLTNYLQKTKVPMLIAADLERGGNGIANKGTKFASQMEIAATGNVEYAKKLAEVCAKEGQALGANWAFAPVCDVDMNFRNPIMNVRTYGDDVDRVIEMSGAYVDKVQEMGMAASIKHFPGDGVDERDQHLLSSVNSLSTEEWDATYGKIYSTLIDQGAMTVMVGHILQPAYSKKLNPSLEDKDILPGTLSKELMTDLLRNQLEFNGLICTDASTMAGFTVPMERAKAVPTTIQAGADMFLFSRNMREDVGFMKKGYEDGIITEERLNDAVTRVLALKAALKLNEQRHEYSAEEAAKVVGCSQHHEWAKQVAEDAVTLVKEEKGVLPLTPEKYPRIMYYPLEQAGKFGLATQAGICDKFKALLEKEGFEVTQFNPENASEGRVAPMSNFIGKYDAMIYLANIATKSNQTTVRIEWASPLGANCPHFVTKIPTIFVSVENPYHLLDAPRIRTFINAYSSNDEVLEAVVDKLTGRSEFKGTNPVDPFCGKWDTHLQ